MICSLMMTLYTVSLKCVIMPAAPQVCMGGHCPEHDGGLLQRWMAPLSLSHYGQQSLCWCHYPTQSLTCCFRERDTARYCVFIRLYVMVQRNRSASFSTLAVPVLILGLERLHWGEKWDWTGSVTKCCQTSVCSLQLCQDLDPELHLLSCPPRS